MEVTTERAYKVTTEMTHTELDEFVGAVEKVYGVFAKNHLKTEDLDPLMRFKDELVMSVHNAKSQGI